MIVLDTAELDAADRAEAVQATLSASASTSLVTFEDADTMWARLNLVELGPGRVFNTKAGGMMLRRTPKVARASEEHRIALAVPLDGPVRLETADGERFFQPREMFLVDMSDPYQFGWRAIGSSYAFQVDADSLGLRIDSIRLAMRQLQTSPLYPVVRDHVIAVTSRAESLADEPGSATVGAATVDLMRALIVSAARDSRAAATTDHDTLVARVLAYTAVHVRDPELGPERIATAHHVSVRHLYRVLEEHEISLEQWLIDRRLQGARAAIADDTTCAKTIGALSREWGFTSPSFFSARFRRAFGMTPQQWRETSARQAPGDD